MKITSGKYRGRYLESPRGKNVRPTSEKLRACVFNICQNIVEGSHFLDLFAGSGAMGLEAISRGAELTAFVEIDRSTIQTIRKNIMTLGVEEKTYLLCGDALVALKRLIEEKKSFHLIFIDPPYEDQKHVEILQFIDQSSLLNEGGQLFLEHRYPFEISLEKLSLKSTRQFGDTYLQQYIL